MKGDGWVQGADDAFLANLALPDGFFERDDSVALDGPGQHEPAPSPVIEDSAWDAMVVWGRNRKPAPRQAE